MSPTPVSEALHFAMEDDESAIGGLAGQEVCRFAQSDDTVLPLDRSGGNLNYRGPPGSWFGRSVIGRFGAGFADCVAGKAGT